jgi:hypothetical protein
MIKTTFKIIMLWVCLGDFEIAYGQKRNDIQIGNLWLNNAKVDGKLTEWQLPLKAHNKATHIQYSIANDDKNLYLAVQTNWVAKLESGGLTLVVNDASITFPYNKRRDRRKKENLGPLKPGEPIRLEDFKEIHIANIESINDSLMSIYNPYGIRTSGIRYEKNGERFCDYEMAIPLKFLGLSAANQIINYTIRLNGIIPTNPGGPGGTTVPIPGKSQRDMMELEERMLDLVRVSKLSGKYNLAQKP